MEPPIVHCRVDLEEFIVTLAVVKGPDKGLRQPVLVNSPDRPVVVIELLSKVIAALVYDILELGDLLIVLPSRVEPLTFPFSRGVEHSSRVSFYIVIGPALAEV